MFPVIFYSCHSSCSHSSSASYASSHIYSCHSSCSHSSAASYASCHVLQISQFIYPNSLICYQSYFTVAIVHNYIVQQHHHRHICFQSHFALPQTQFMSTQVTQSHFPIQSYFTMVLIQIVSSLPQFVFTQLHSSYSHDHMQS